MSLQFADINADGIEDIVTAVWEGTLFTVLGSSEGFEQPEYIRDTAGELIVMTRYYDVKGRKYVNESSDHHLISAMVWDWDGDGDLDLILGSKDGRVELRKNEGKAGAAKFATASIPLMAGDQPLVVPGGSTAPRRVDWDADGLDDLVCGSFKGGAYWYRNVGAPSAPKFAAPVKLLAAPEGAASPGESRPESGWYVEPVDYDGDGDLDLLVGARFMNHPKPRQLSAEETSRLAEVDAELEVLNARWNVGYRKLRADTKSDTDAFQKAYSAWSATPEVRALNKARAGLREEKMKLRPSARQDSGVWLYRRLTAQAGNGG